MQKKYLLYIDILGFSEHVRKGSLRTRRIYEIIEGLNAHAHDAFRVIVFSDTILIYNIFDPLTQSDREYNVMFLIEFAQNLLYEFSGKGLFFRSLLVFGNFEHVITGRFEKYFGTALVRAYQKEKSIKSCGLFIDNFCQKDNVIFPTMRHDRDVSFVYLNQSLDSFYQGEFGSWPVDGALLESCDAQWRLAKDIAFLKEVFELKTQSPDEAVRFKMRTTWSYYEQRFPMLLGDLASNGFSLSVLSSNCNWKPAVDGVREGYKGFSTCVPTLEEIRIIVDEARTEGTAAAGAEFERLYPEGWSPSGPFHPCGGAIIYVDIDGRSRLAKALKNAASELGSFSFCKFSGGDYSLSIRGMHQQQDRSIDVAAQRAVLNVLVKRLGIVGTIHEYYD